MKIDKPYRLYDHTNTEEGIEILRDLWNNFDDMSAVETSVGFLSPEFKEKGIIDTLFG